MWESHVHSGAFTSRPLLNAAFKTTTLSRYVFLPVVQKITEGIRSWRCKRQTCSFSERWPEWRGSMDVAAQPYVGSFMSSCYFFGSIDHALPIPNRLSKRAPTQFPDESWAPAMAQESEGAVQGASRLIMRTVCSRSPRIAPVGKYWLPPWSRDFQ